MQGDGGEMSSQNPIDAILEAERDAEVQIERRRDEARETINQAMEDARVISERARRRITKIHSRCTDAVEVQCEALWHDYEAAPKTVIDDLATPERLDRIANLVAAKLTGARDA